MAKRKTTVPLNSVAMIGDHLPRQCGIATFTTDLCDALDQAMSGRDQVEVVTMDDVPAGYNYPRRVSFQVRATVQADYLRAADFINVNRFDLAICQHEFGIYGGESGSYVLSLIRLLRMPVLTNLHTILARPTEAQRSIMLELERYSDRLLVMSRKAQQLLEDVYDIPTQRTTIIPHGIPDVPFSDPRFYKHQFDLEERLVVLTFGLLSPGKGIEYMLDAMPAVVEKHPDVIYIVLGVTHPHVLRATGDAYRSALLQRISRLHLGDHVKLVNEFVDLETLSQYLGAADVYVTPYLNEEQITSGTLAYAMGSGTAVVSTPYWHACELLDDGRGCLVPFEDSDALAEQVNRLLDDDGERHAIRRRAYYHTRDMVWQQVAHSYLSLAEEVLDGLADAPKPHIVTRVPSRFVHELPEIDLQHLRTLSDDTGIVQHAAFATAERSHGYRTEDNASALIAASMYHNLRQDDSVIGLIQTYMAFLHHAYNAEAGRFRHRMQYDRQWADETGSEEVHAQALRCLGATVKYAPSDPLRDAAARLLAESLPAVERFASPNAMADALIGLHDYLAVYGGDSTARRLRQHLAARLHECFADADDRAWPWHDNVVGRASATLAHALIMAGQWIPDPQIYDRGVRTLQWLLDLQTAPEGHRSLIGSEGWLSRDGGRSHFDQLPADAMALTAACAEVYRCTEDKYWLEAARRGLQWFLGRNDLQMPMYNFKTGGCYDSLQLHGPNLNQGAEATLSWLRSLMTMYEILGRERVVEPPTSTRPPATDDDADEAPGPQSTVVHAADAPSAPADKAR